MHDNFNKLLTSQQVFDKDINSYNQIKHTYLTQITLYVYYLSHLSDDQLSLAQSTLNFSSNQYAIMHSQSLFTDLGERMAKDPSYLPLENLPEGHPWTGPADLRDLVAAMLSFDPSHRPDAGTVLHKMEALCKPQGQLIILKISYE